MILLSPEGAESKSSPSSCFVSSLADLPPQDYIILGLKTHQIASVLADLRSLLERSPEATLVTTQNGVPWWFFQQFPGPASFRDLPLLTVDPDGELFRGLDPKCIVATIVYPAAHIAFPGVVQHTDGVRFPVGELSGEVDTVRIVTLSAILVDAGFKSPVLPDVRGELWLKLWGSVAFNPLSALTHATLEELCTFPRSRGVVEAMMREVESVGAAVGIRLRLPLERRIDGAAKVGNHKTSTLQDCESGRAMEIDAIMGGVVEIARITHTPTPHVDAIYGAASMLAHVLETRKAALPLAPLAAMK
jgi:2-dehydropantoate 2-reductase